MNVDFGSVVQYVAFASALVAAWVAARKAPSETRKVIAESELIRVDTQAKIIDDLQEEVDRRKKENQYLEQEIKDVRDHFQKEIEKQRRECDEERRTMERKMDELVLLNIQHQKRIVELSQAVDSLRNNQ